MQPSISRIQQIVSERNGQGFPFAGDFICQRQSSRKDGAAEGFTHCVTAGRVRVLNVSGWTRSRFLPNFLISLLPAARTGNCGNLVVPIKELSYLTRSTQYCRIGQNASILSKTCQSPYGSVIFQPNVNAFGACT